MLVKGRWDKYNAIKKNPKPLLIFRFGGYVFFSNTSESDQHIILANEIYFKRNGEIISREAVNKFHEGRMKLSCFTNVIYEGDYGGV